MKRVKFSSENKMINAIGFQLVWWMAVLYQGLSVAPTLILIAAHFFGLTKDRRAEFSFILKVTLVGVAVDTLFANIGVLSFYHARSESLVLVPLWLVTLWAAFACTLRHSISWSVKKPWLAFMVGAIAGPLSYLAASNFDVIKPIEFCSSAHVTMSCFWGLLFLAVSLCERGR